MKCQSLFLISFQLFIGISSYAQESHVYTQPRNLADGWISEHLESVVSDPSRIYKMFDQLENQDHKLHSVLLIKEGKLILEKYFNGESIDKPHDLRSTTKSIRALLMGIAIDQRFIESIDDPISKYLKTHSPEKNLDARKDKITIKHLLTMSPGWDCNDWNKNSKGQEDKMYKKKDWLQSTLDLPMINEPGEVASYCSMGAIMIAEIISQASGMPINQFAQKFLFDPMGIENLDWGHTSNKKVIASGKRLYMTSRDLAKIGQLVLNKGSWNGIQIVSESWIEEATTPKTQITGIDYGYFWLNIPFNLNGQPVVAKTATGNGGQYIMVFPEMNLVAVFTGGAYNSQEDKVPFSMMQQVILPAFNKS